MVRPYLHIHPGVNSFLSREPFPLFTPALVHCCTTPFQRLRTPIRALPRFGILNQLVISTHCVPISFLTPQLGSAQRPQHGSPASKPPDVPDALDSELSPSVPDTRTTLCYALPPAPTRLAPTAVLSIPTRSRPLVCSKALLPIEPLRNRDSLPVQ